MKNLWMIILVGGLGAGCEKKETGDAGKPGAAKKPVAVTPKPPPTKPVAGQKTKPTKPKPSPPANMLKPLPPAVVAAWERAGWFSGWMGSHKKYDQVIFSQSLEVLEASRAVPAFKPKARAWKPGVLESLPAPETAFGLDLMHPGITDAGLKEVAKLQQLSSLNLSFTKITDGGLKEVAKLQQFTILNLRGTQITDAGVAELKKALPKCEIHH